MRRCLFLAACLFFVQSVVAQKETLSPKQHLKQGKKALDQQEFASAAAHFEAAWRSKPNQLGAAFEAGRAYLLARDYRKAVELLEKVKDNPDVPSARLLYAQALQQSEQFDAAIPEYLIYLNNYTLPDRDKVVEAVEDKIKGCTMAIQQSDSTQRAEKVRLSHLNESVNSADNEIAPIPYGDDVLYFTIQTKQSIRLARTQAANDDWAPAQAVTSLPIPQQASFGNGSFSPDGRRFYYTQCANSVVKNSECGIYVLERTDIGWSIPQALPLTINLPNTLNTHPFVWQKDNFEYLLFSSDRKGGQGGMDIWFTKREKQGSAVFDAPTNLGTLINTGGDELTPVYDVEKQALYFASNGRPTFGGLDIFKAKGAETQWLTPENMGFPYNSGSDDWYYVENKSKTGGYFVSNRVYGMEKIGSTDDDIFSFTLKTTENYQFSGEILDKTAVVLIENARASLYEKRQKNNLRLLSSVMSSDGRIQFPLLADKDYVIEVEKEGYRLMEWPFSTKNRSRDSARQFEHRFLLDKYVILAHHKTDEVSLPTDENKDVVEVKINTKPTKTEPKTEPKVVAKPNTPTTKPTPNTVRTPSKKVEGVTYKVQVIAYEQIDYMSLKRLERVEDLGRFDTEQAMVNGKKFTRVMLASFDTYDEAINVLKQVKGRSLSDAFIIRYENGQRTDKSR